MKNFLRIVRAIAIVAMLVFFFFKTFIANAEDMETIFIWISLSGFILLGTINIYQSVTKYIKF